MTRRERLFRALRFEEPDRPPHFEMAFQLVEEAFGLSFPDSNQILNAAQQDKALLFGRCAEIYEKTIEKYQWDAVAIWTPAQGHTALPEFTAFIRKFLDDDISVFPAVWNSVVCIETVQDYMQFSIDISEEPEKIHNWAEEMCKRAIEDCRLHLNAGCDGILLPCDLAFNAGPFLSPSQFAEFTAPYLKRIVDYVQHSGSKIILHSDGNLTPVMDQILAIRPDVLQSIDPMARMDIAEIKKITYGKIALMGNVQCSLLQDGPDEKLIASANDALRHGAPGGGFIYSSSNTIFKGLPVRNYEIMLDCLHKRYRGLQK